MNLQQYVIPQLDPPIKSEDGIQYCEYVLDCPVKPDNDKKLKTSVAVYNFVLMDFFDRGIRDINRLYLVTWCLIKEVL
jgi:hypothetical protein